MDIRQPYLFYQEVTEPIVTELIDETVTTDKWYVQRFNPILRKVALSAAIIAGALFFDATPVGSQETITQDKWGQPQSQPYFAKKRQLMPTGETRFEVPRTILQSDWNQPQSQPYFSKKRDSKGYFSISDKPIVSFDAIRPQSEPYFPKKRFIPSGEYRFEVPRDILLTDWFQPIAQPRIVKLRDANTGGVLVEFSTLVVETITVDKWFVPIGQPRIVQKRNYFTGETRFEVPRLIVVSDWFTPINQPYFSKKRDSTGLTARLDVLQEVVTLDKWFRETVQLRIIKQRQQPFYNAKLETIVVPFDWSGKQPEQIRRELRRLYNAQFTIERTFFVPEIVTLDKWFAPVQQPTYRVVQHQQGWFVSFDIQVINPIFLEEIVFKSVIKNRADKSKVGSGNLDSTNKDRSDKSKIDDANFKSGIDAV